MNPIIQNFKEWLTTLGYNPTDIYNLPRYIKSFYNYINPEKPSSENIHQFFKYLQQRGNLRTGQPLSATYLNHHLQALKLLSKYLRTQNQESFKVTVPFIRLAATEKETLSIDEIKSLYEATENNPLGLRDKAMLAVFYACGLRRNEGVNLNIKEVLLEAKLLYVRKGKNHKERYVPMSAATVDTMKTYLEIGRPFIYKHHFNEALFISMKGQRINGMSLAIRLKKLLQKAEINKDISLHGLRHSIATHLLQQGMPMVEVSRFLGHSSLESTQIYTQLRHE